MNKNINKVGIIMGSYSDLEVMSEAAEVLKDFKIPYEIEIVSAHRTPDRMYEYATTAEDRGLEVIIAGAGGSAHLPGMTASLTAIPVIGVPIKSKALNGIDSLLSIVQMPTGVPVATVAINGAKNAAILSIKILANKYPDLKIKLKKYVENMKSEVRSKNKEIPKKIR